MSGDTETLRDADLIPLLNAPEQVARHFSPTRQAHAFGVQLDTGMNRLGMEPADWTALSSELMVAGPRLVMSHLACADEPDHPMNAQQIAHLSRYDRWHRHTAARCRPLAASFWVPTITST